MQRRTFIKASAGVMCGLAAGCNKNGQMFGNDRDFKISLAQWSFHKKLFGGDMDNLDFASESKRLGFEGIEYVNGFFKDKGRDTNYLAQMKKRASDAGIKSLLIMCDGEGNLGDPDKAKREQAIKNHHQWVDAAKYLGCHSIRVNAQSEGTYEEQMKLSIPSNTKR